MVGEGGGVRIRILFNVYIPGFTSHPSSTTFKYSVSNSIFSSAFSFSTLIFTLQIILFPYKGIVQNVKRNCVFTTNSNYLIRKCLIFQTWNIYFTHNSMKYIGFTTFGTVITRKLWNRKSTFRLNISH